MVFLKASRTYARQRPVPRHPFPVTFLVFLPTPRTELRRRPLGLVSAAGALALRREVRAAVGAELRALRLRAALAADGAGDLADVARLRPVDLARLLLDLLARGLGLRRGHLFVEVGRSEEHT